MKYPETRRVDQVDEFYGVKVPDPYRWLEADVRESPEVAEWVKKQNEVARAYLDAIPQRPAIEKRLTELWNYERYSPPTQKGGKYFYSKNDGLQNQSVLYVADSYNAEGRVLIDPNKWSKDGTIALSSFSAERRRPLPGLRPLGSRQRLAADLRARRRHRQAARRPAEVGPLRRHRLDEGRQRLLLQPLSRAAAGRAASGGGAQPDDLLPQAGHEAGRRQAGLPPARPSRLELLASADRTTASTWCSRSRAAPIRRTRCSCATRRPRPMRRSRS